jgi:hypothetical protein
MITHLVLYFALPLALTLFIPGVRALLAAIVSLGGVIGWQDFAYWQAANSPDFIGPPALPIGSGAVSLAAAGLMIGAFTRAIGIGLNAAGLRPAPAWHLVILTGVSAVIGSAYYFGLIRF